MPLTPEQIERAWKDEEYRLSLSPEELAALPESPLAQASGILDDDELDDIAGGTGVPSGSLGCVI